MRDVKEYNEIKKKSKDYDFLFNDNKNILLNKLEFIERNIFNTNYDNNESNNDIYHNFRHCHYIINIMNRRDLHYLSIDNDYKLYKCIYNDLLNKYKYLLNCYSIRIRYKPIHYYLGSLSILN